MDRASCHLSKYPNYLLAHGVLPNDQIMCYLMIKMEAESKSATVILCAYCILRMGT